MLTVPFGLARLLGQDMSMFNNSIRSQQTNEDRGFENDGLTQNSAIFQWECNDISLYITGLCNIM